MLVIYIDKQTNRLGYTINLIFKQLLNIDYIVTCSRDRFIALSGEKLSYCNEPIFDEFHIDCSPIMFETSVHSMDINHKIEDGIDKIFISYAKDDVLGFDIFAATFFMVTRYEEYLPFISDKHDRFAHTDSIAYSKQFLYKPVVNIWVEFLKEKLLARYPSLQCQSKQFSFVNTIDIDMAYCYKSKGFYRSIGGIVRDLTNRQLSDCIERIKVLFFGKKDPFDCYDYLLTLLNKYKMETIMFFLFSFRSKYDKNISPYNYKFQMLLKTLSDFVSIGIHPCYYAMEYPISIISQIKHIASIIHKPVLSSRFHYLRFRLPRSYREVLNDGITEEYSMGYSEDIGFRAGICCPYNFYDLEADQETKLKIHPFVFMDVALKNALNLTLDQAWERIHPLIDLTIKYNGELVTVWHNESLSDKGQWQGWRALYEKELTYVYDKMYSKNAN